MLSNAEMADIKCAVNSEHAIPLVDIMSTPVKKPQNFHIVCAQKHILYYEINPLAQPRITPKIEMNKVSELRLEDVRAKMPSKYWDDLTLFENSYVMEFQHGMASALRGLLEGFVNDYLSKCSEVSTGLIRSAGVEKILKGASRDWSNGELYDKDELKRVKEAMENVDKKNKLKIGTWKLIYDCYNRASDCLHGVATGSFKLYAAFKQFVDFVLELESTTYEWTSSDGE